MEIILYSLHCPREMHWINVKLLLRRLLEWLSCVFLAAFILAALYVSDFLKLFQMEELVANNAGDDEIQVFDFLVPKWL